MQRSAPNPGNYEFAQAVFSCSELAAEISSKTGQPQDVVDEVTVGRRFNGQFTLWFPKFQPKNHAAASDINAILQSASTELAGITALQKEGSLKESLTQRIQSALSQVASGGATAQALDLLIATLKTAVPAEIAPTSSLVPRYQRMLDDLAELKTALQRPSPGQVDGVWALIESKLPKFLYYSNYGNLDSEIYLPHVAENLKRTDLGAKEAAKARTLKVLFSFVRLEPEDILELGQEAQPVKGLVQEDDIAEAAERKHERTILLNSAGTDLTKKFKSWWRQGDYTFEFQANGDHFRIWVSDQHYLTAIKTILIAAGEMKPTRELIFPRTHGARNAQVIATILSRRNDVLPVMLLDGDAAGMRMAGDMRNGLYKGAKTRVVDTNGYVGFENSEIEDLIPPDTIIIVLDRWQKGADHEFETVAKPGLPVVPQIVAWAEAEGLGLDEGWKVELARRVKERLLARGPKDLEEEVIERWSKLFKDIVV